MQVKTSFVSKTTSYLLVFTAMSLPLFAQQHLVYAEDAPGKITGAEPAGYFKRIDAIKNIDKARSSSLKKCVAKQLAIFYSDPLFNPPKGFVARTSSSIANDPFASSLSFPAFSFTFDLYYLEKDRKTGEVKTSMDGTLIGMETNATAHFFRQVGNFWKDCDDVNFPLFFEQLPITDSTGDYIELDFKKYGYPAIAPSKPFRIIKRNNKPLFIPLARKEFFQFLIAREKYRIHDNEGTITDLQNSIKESQKTLKNPPAYLTDAVKKALADGVASTEKQVAQTREEIKKKQATIKGYEDALNAMSPQEASSAVRIDEQKPVPDFDDLKRLVPYTQSGGVGLYKINPAYYDRSAAAPAIQLIMVYYDLPAASVFEKTSLNYLEKKTLDIFKRLDYHALKVSMQ